jgi:CelD/BcsL family acetyltransferase involved in cellulose biosynthesis
MHVTLFTNLTELAPLATDWDRLAGGVPFRSWTWQSAWWRHYGGAPSGHRQKTRLYVLVVYSTAGVPVGIAPWYWEHTSAKGRVLRFLGLGEIASDHLSVLCQPGMEDAVTGALADWLTDANRPHVGAALADDSSAWDLLELTGADTQDARMTRLAEALERRGYAIHRRPGVNCWALELPNRWEDFLPELPKTLRQHCRRTDKWLSAGRATMHCVENLADLSMGQEILLDLHQRRRQSLGEPGCFASPQFTAFHQEVMPELLRQGRLCLSWVEIDGRPVATDYLLSGEGVMYVYQGGMAPEEKACSPGHLITMLMIRRAIEQGYRVFDFLRGDEPYKAQWHAQPRASVELRIVAPRASARLRHTLWQTGSCVKRWLKNSLS